MVGVGRPVRLKVGHLSMGDGEPWVFKHPAQVVAVHKRIGVIDPAPTLYVHFNNAIHQAALRRSRKAGPRHRILDLTTVRKPHKSLAQLMGHRSPAEADFLIYIDIVWEI